MNISTKIILTTIFVSTLGVGGLARTAYATKIPSRLLATPQHQSSTKVAEADSPNDSDSGVKEDGDREASDTAKAPEADSPNDRNSGTKEDGDREASDTAKTPRVSYTKQQQRKYHQNHRYHSTRTHSSI